MIAKQFRVALTTHDFEQAISFYRDGLGLEPRDLWTDNGRGQLLGAGEATLEIFDEEYAAGVDQIEAGERVSGQIRFAFEVPDIHAAMARALQYGATLMHEPVLTPWQDLNVRLRSSEGLQITLFQTQTDTNNAKEGNE
jgi:methylmalonyl-CoA/ethylmalonyl-CoA epimerase